MKKTEVVKSASKTEDVKIVKKTFITKQDNISDVYLVDAKVYINAMQIIRKSAVETTESSRK